MPSPVSPDLAPARRLHRWVGFVLALAGAAAALAGLPAGCGRADAEREDAPIRLELWTLALRPTFTDYMQDLCDAFEAEHPGVEVVWVDVPYNAINRKLVAAAASGQAPDVVNLADRDFARFASLGALIDLQPHLPAEALADYLPGVMHALRLGDQQLALPWYLTTSVRLCNTPMLAEGGLDPDTLADGWSALRDQARAYHQETGESSQLPGMLLADGVAPFAERDGRLVADLTKPAVVERVRAWVGLYRDGVLPRAAATRGHEHLVELYQSGELAVVQTGPNMLRRIGDASPEVFAATAVRPPITGRLGRAHVAVMVVAVTRQSAHPDLAAALARAVTGAANQSRLARMATVMPSTRASLDDPYFAGAAEAGADDGEARRIAEARAMAARSLREAVAFTPALETWPDLRRSFDEQIKAALLEGRDVAATLAEIERQWDAILRAARPATLDAVPQPAPLPRENISQRPPLSGSEGRDPAQKTMKPDPALRFAQGRAWGGAWGGAWGCGWGLGEGGGR